MSNYKLDFTGEQVNELLRKVSEIGDGASSWNDFEDKPFGETTVIGDTVTFDGDLTGKTYVSLDIDGETLCFVQVSDSVPTLEELQQGGIVAVTGMGEIPFDSTMVTDMGQIIMAGTDGAAIVAKEDNADATEIFGVILPKKGVYAIYAPDMGMATESITINGYNGFVTTKIDYIDNKFLEPFETKEVPSQEVLVDSETVSFAQDGGGVSGVLENVVLKDGSVYTVIFDGTEYADLTASPGVYSNMDSIYISFSLDDGRAVKFHYILNGAYTGIFIYIDNTPTSITATITLTEYGTAKQTKLKRECLPDANIVFTIDSAAPGNTNSAVVTCNKLLTTMMKMSLEELQDAKVVWTVGGTPAYITRPINVMAGNASDGDKVLALFLEMSDLASLDVYIVGIAESGNGVERLAK